MGTRLYCTWEWYIWIKKNEVSIAPSYGALVYPPNTPSDGALAAAKTIKFSDGDLDYSI